MSQSLSFVQANSRRRIMAFDLTRGKPGNAGFRRFTRFPEGYRRDISDRRPRASSQPLIDKI
ncbi:hypothetical protein FRZ61_28050 [Hypericibacter adhaerens]|uniref:Uncharacterized protein n=1 Tax=Hypericibacter adhaerens TaxID=2602016 RepID=A0A5J6MZR4_9PROT|nr:hypothetical protein FRZ61_28050 [Hypericibacter adhaerens]